MFLSVLYGDDLFDSLITKHIHNLHRRAVFPAGYFDAGALVGGVHDFSVAYVDGHVVDIASTAVEYQITGLYVALRDSGAGLGLLGRGAA